MYECELGDKEGWAPKKWCFQIVVLEKTLESPLDSKKIKPVSPKGNQPWIFIGRTDTEALILWLLILWCKELTHWKRPWCWERLRTVGEGGDRGWDGWMASLTQWPWVWPNSGRWWTTGKPGMVQSMRWQSQTWLSNWITTVKNIGFSLESLAALASFKRVSLSFEALKPCIDFSSQAGEVLNDILFQDKVVLYTLKKFWFKVRDMWLFRCLNT